MPKSGQSNLKFAVYMSGCCGAEIVIAEGARFPYRPEHPEQPTTWTSADDEQFVRPASCQVPKSAVILLRNYAPSAIDQQRVALGLPFCP